MRPPARSAINAGFTLVELMISMSLALMIIAAVLSSYIFLGRNLGRLVTQQTLENGGRRTLAYFAQDVRMASGISGTPTASSVTFIIPSGATTTTVAYAYNSATGTITRTPASGTSLTLASNLLSLYLRYYNETGTAYDNGSIPYTTQTTYMSGVKQISLVLTSQTGSAENGTRTAVNNFTSPRLLIRNRALLD